MFLFYISINWAFAGILIFSFSKTLKDEIQKKEEELAEAKRQQSEGQERFNLAEER